MKKIYFHFVLLIPVLGYAQSCSIGWYKIAGGGGISTKGHEGVMKGSIPLLQTQIYVRCSGNEFRNFS